MKKMRKIFFAAYFAVPAANTPGDTDTGLTAALERLRRQETTHRRMNEAYGKNGG
jgi:hypothetical protein